jgi:hypothetical protein
VCTCLFRQNFLTLEDLFSKHLLGQSKCVHSFDKKAIVTPSLEPLLSIWSTSVHILVYCSSEQQCNSAKHSVSTTSLDKNIKFWSDPMQIHAPGSCTVEYNSCPCVHYPTFVRLGHRQKYWRQNVNRELPNLKLD